MRFKHMAFAVMEDIHADGSATRKQLWERNPVCSWEMFKRLLGKLVVDGVVERVRTCPPATDITIDTWRLTKEGEELVQLSLE